MLAINELSRIASHLSWLGPADIGAHGDSFEIRRDEGDYYWYATDALHGRRSCRSTFSSGWIYKCLV